MKLYMAIAALPLVAAVGLVGVPAHAADEEEPQVVKVELKEWDIGFKEVAVKGEKARFEIENHGTMPHGFALEAEIKGETVEFAVPELNPGERTVLVVKLPNGKYEIHCPVPGHEDKGMAGEITFGKASRY